METIMIMAQALAKAARTEISRLDIQYNTKDEAYKGRVWLQESKGIFDLYENGTVTLPH